MTCSFHVQTFTNETPALTDAVITQAAMACSGRAEYFAGEAVLEFDRLTSDGDLADSRRGAVRVPGLRIWNLRDLFLDVRRLVLNGKRDSNHQQYRRLSSFFSDLFFRCAVASL